MAESSVTVYILRPPDPSVSPLMNVCLWSGKLGFESLSGNPRSNAGFESAAHRAARSETDTRPIKALATSQERRSSVGCGAVVDKWIWRSLAFTICALIVGLLVAYRPPSADARPAGAPRCFRPSMTATQAIDCLWPARSRRAARAVAECESTASAPERVARRRGLGRWARNGRYVGIFQMGRAERRSHGWYRVGAPAHVQVASALGLYRSRGWQPWECA